MVDQTKFIGPGLLLFLDQSVIAAGNWVYWLLISKIVSPSEVGQATIILSLVSMISTIIQLGFEYPLLKKSLIQRSRILGTTLGIELVITLASLPLIFYILGNMYRGSLQEFTWIAIGILILSSLIFVSRFALLGISDVKKILIIDSMGMVAKFMIGYVSVLIGFGAFGILLSILSQFFIISSAALIITNKIFSFKLGNIRYVKEIILDGLFNAPSKLSRALILSLSIVLLASFGISNSQIGIFYVALVISIVIGGFASSMAYTAIPASSLLRTDLSSASLRIGLNFSAPLISALIVAPKSILSLIGTGYVSGDGLLLVLSISIFPAAVTMNAISKFNNLGESKKLVSIGSVEIMAFLLGFVLLVPHYGPIGAAFSILIAFGSSAALSIIWSERASMRYIAISTLAIFVGFTSGYLMKSILAVQPLVMIVASIGSTMIIILLLKNTNPKEIRELIKSLIKKN